MAITVFHLTCSANESSQPARLADAEKRFAPSLRPSLLVRDKGGAEAEILRRSLGQVLRDRLDKRKEKALWADYPGRRRDVLLSSNQFGKRFAAGQLERADLIHLHWVAGRTICGDALARVARPMAFTLHDCWPFTAVCHYPFDCAAYREGCPGICPQAGGDVSRFFHAKKRWMDRIESLTVVTPSLWLKERAETSPMFSDRRVEHIFNPLDTEVFSPGHRQEARSRWNIPDEATVLCFGSVDVNSPYKGGELIAPVLKRLHEKGICRLHLLIFGGGAPDARYPYPSTHVGYLAGMADVASVYRASDLLLNPSKQDVFSYVAAESQACGIPCAAFATGGIPEVVLHGETGLISPQFDLDDMAENIALLIEDADLRERMGRAARAQAVARFSYPVIAARHEELYREIMRGRPIGNAGKAS